jgi:hypothetical protein
MEKIEELEKRVGALEDGFLQLANGMNNVIQEGANLASGIRLFNALKSLSEDLVKMHGRIAALKKSSGK